MVSKIKTSNIIYFIGGAADKTRERFGVVRWGPTNLVGLIKNHFDALKGSFSDTRYYSYLEKDDIIRDIIHCKDANPDLRINLVGHSRGGAVANEIATMVLPRYKTNSNILVLLDPVKARPTDHFILPNNKNVSIANTFICVYAKPLRRDPTDYVAIVGGQYGLRLQECCDYFIQADANHGEPNKMLKLELDTTGCSAWDILLKESETAF